MERHHISQTLTIDRKYVQQSAYAILQMICFHRMLGTVRPAVVDVFGLHIPAISDPKRDSMLQTYAADLAALASANPAPNGVELRVEFSLPLSKRTLSGVESRANTSTSAGGGAGGIANTAAASIRAWASPRNYQYGWLATAFSGGAGQPSHPYDSPSSCVEQEEQSEVFESWTFTFCTPNRDEGLAGAQTALAQTSNKILTWIGEHNSHLPSAPSADLTPYPIRIFVRAIP